MNEIDSLKQEIEILRKGNHALIDALSRVNRAALKHKPDDPGWKYVFTVLCDLDEILKNLNKK